jgi:fucose permease
VGTSTFTRNRFTWLAYLFLAFYGYFLNILGPITPFLKDELHLSYTVSSFHFTAFAFGIIIAGISGNFIIRRIGRWNALWIAAFGISLSALLLLAGHDPLITIGASFLMGCIGSLILAVVPSSLSDQYGEMRAVALSEANVIASMVSSAAPLLVGWLANTPAGWRSALMFAGLAPLAMRFGFGKVSMPAETRASQSTDAPSQPLPARYWVYWTALMLAVSVEYCMIFWSADYLEKQLGMPKAGAAQTVSLFLVGMILGRLASSRLVQRFSAHRVVTVSVLLAAAGFMLYWNALTPLMGAAGLFFTGLGVASLYPLILSLAIGVSNGNTVAASARSSLASGTAIFALPLVLGRLADAVGIRLAYSVIVFLLVGVFLIIQATTRFSVPAQPARSEPL